MNDRQIRFVLPLPDRNAAEFTMTPARRHRRTTEEAQRAWEQSVRAKWRSLAIVIKAKLVAVEDRIVTFEQEFGMHIVLPGGVTVEELVTPAIEQAYIDGSPAPLFGALDAQRQLAAGGL